MPKILILTTSHGAAHRRASEALRKAFIALDSEHEVAVMDAIGRCALWFRAYYDSYEIPLRLWPGLWRRIERYQHQQASTSPLWLYRLGGRPLFKAVRAFDPDIVIATEVGVCELSALHKRQTRAQYFLVGLELMDFNQAWIQPEVDLYPAVHSDFAAELQTAGAPASKVIVSGMPIDPAFARLPDQYSVRKRLALQCDLPLVLTLFGGTGFGKPRRIVAELKKIRQPFQAVFIAGKNPALQAELEALCRGVPGWSALGWVDNVHEWMAAADLLLSKPGGATLMEACACGLPLLAFDPLPGNEERTCRWIEKRGVGVWIKSAAEIAATVEGLLSDDRARASLQKRARAVARADAARDAANAILAAAGMLRPPLPPLPEV
ncbi:MAG TPA: glycosyltransferase [Terriglobia bacterium]|nr:glycosyltransferase [Terriglobia bacterium]